MVYFEESQEISDLSSYLIKLVKTDFIMTDNSIVHDFEVFIDAYSTDIVIENS